ncbi:MAG: hypothetical protein ACRC0J_15205 [Shewanella oncorhynchi]
MTTRIFHSRSEYDKLADNNFSFARKLEESVENSTLVLPELIEQLETAINQILGKVNTQNFQIQTLQKEIRGLKNTGLPLVSFPRIRKQATNQLTGVNWSNSVRRK